MCPRGPGNTESASEVILSEPLTDVIVKAQLGCRQVREPVQVAMYCRCGRERIIANGMCGTCYTLRRQDEAYFGGLREAVLERDGHRCRVCDAPGGGRRELVVHHRVPGKSVLNLMITLCPACHAKVHRTIALVSLWPPLLVRLWREQHPDGHEQTALEFAIATEPVRSIRLF